MIDGAANKAMQFATQLIAALCGKFRDDLKN